MEEDINPNVPIKRSYEKIIIYIIIVVLCILVFYFAWVAYGKSTEPPPAPLVSDTRAMAEDIKKQLEEAEPEPEPEPEPVKTEPTPVEPTPAEEEVN